MFQFSSDHRHNIHPLSPKNVDFSTMRVFSIEKYGDVWIPTLGLDIALN